MEATEFFIVKTNIWFGGKLYEAGDCIALDPASPEVQKLVAKELIVSTGTLVDASEPIPSVEETVEDIKPEIVEEENKVEEQVQVQEKVEPEPELKQDHKLNKRGKSK